MIRCLLNLAAKFRTRPFIFAFVGAILLAASGCTNMNMRGEGFADDPMTDLARRLRQVDEQAESFAFSNKARQIDRDLGVR